MSLQWYTVKGEADRGTVKVDVETLADSPEAAKQEALAMIGDGARWKATPDVQPADQEEE